MEFEWDAKKATANLRRHGIVFADAVHVFERPYLERLDERRDYGEHRYVIYGEMRNQVIVLVFTWRRTREEDNQCKKSDPEREAYYSTIYSK